jgi:hypothetical protein
VDSKLDLDLDLVLSTIERTKKDKTFGFLGFGISGHLAVGELSELAWRSRA